MAIIFQKLKYKNFLSVGDNEIEIDLDKANQTLIVGHNGSGKSILLDALSFALFGKPHRGITKPQLVNSINGKGLMTEITFKIGVKDYKIIRGVKPNIFEIWADGKMLNQESHSRDYQKLLENSILKLNHKSFHQVVVLGSGNFTPFLQLPTYQRRTVIEELLDIGIFSKMNLVLKEAAGKLRDEIKDTEAQIERYGDKITMQNAHIDKLASIAKSGSEKRLEELGDLEEQVGTLVKSNQTMLDEHSQNHPKAELRKEVQESKQKKLHAFGSQIELNIKKVTEESNFYAHNSSCPACSQEIDDALRNKKIHSCKEKLDELTEGTEQLRTAKAAAEHELNAAQDELKALRNLNFNISSNVKIINSFESRINDLNKEERESRDSDTNLSKAREECVAMHDQMNTLIELKSAQTEERFYNETTAELLKDTGIKTKIISQYLPVMNRMINRYLNVLDFFVSFELDENFSETIRSRHRDNFTYASFSEGEKARINLALLFAWRAIGKMKNSCDTNLLILDEQFDGSLDADGADNLMKILGTLKNTNVFVISHKTEILEGKFERKCEFKKFNNFTTMKTSETQL